ncbi:hypothetical protein B0H14DRAFT_3608319 [Mycena olivaceomarginata]|nr:hypothetical protein B0H14DRAFT_3608319 [Mycena olivaceomarginata]
MGESPTRIYADFRFVRTKFASAKTQAAKTRLAVELERIASRTYPALYKGRGGSGQRTEDLIGNVKHDCRRYNTLSSGELTIKAETYRNQLELSGGHNLPFGKNWCATRNGPRSASSLPVTCKVSAVRGCPKKGDGDGGNIFGNQDRCKRGWRDDPGSQKECCEGVEGCIELLEAFGKVVAGSWGSSRGKKSPKFLDMHGSITLEARVDALTTFRVEHLPCTIGFDENPCKPPLRYHLASDSDGNRRGRGLEEIIRDGPCASEAKQDQCWWCHTPNVVLFLSHNVNENILGPPSNSEFHPARSVSDNFHPLSARTEYLSSTDRSVKNPS